MANVGELVVQVTSDDSGLQSGVSSSKSSLLSLGNVAAAAGVAIVGAFAAVGKASLKLGMEFDKTMSAVSAITGAVGDDFDELRENAKLLGETTAFSASEAAEGMKFLGMAGFETSEIIAAMPGLLDLAAASGTDLARTADIVSDSMTAFGLSAEETSHFADVLAIASSKANTNVEMLGESFKFVAPIAGSFGFTVEETTAALAVMANSGIKASQAGTTLRGAMIRMADGTGAAGKMMHKLGITMADSEGNMRPLENIIHQLRNSFKDLTEEQQAQAASALFGKNAISGMLAVINDSENEFGKLVVQMEDAEGAAGEMADTMLDNLGGQLTILKSGLEGIGLAVSDVITPAFRVFTSFIQDNLPTIKEITVGAFQAIIDFGGMVANVLGVLYNWFKEFILPVMQDFSNFIMENMPAIQAVTQQALSVIVEWATIVWTFFKEHLVPIIMEIWNVAKAVFPSVKELAVSAFELIKVVAEAAWVVFKDFLVPVFNEIGKVANVVFPVIAKVVGDAFKTVIDISNSLIKVVTAVIETISKALKAVKEFVGASKGTGGGGLSKSESKGFYSTKGGVTSYTDRSTGKTSPAKLSGARANGGPVTSGQSFLVGERGPEIFTPNSSGMITANGKGGGSTNNITINIMSNDPDSIFDELVRRLNQQGVFA